MILIDLKEHSETPIYRQIMDQLVGLIERGDLPFGARLPSTRSMAEKLDVNRSTVYKAYQELWSLGYIDSRPGSYSTVRKRTKVVTPKNRKRSIIDWDRAATLESADLVSSLNIGETGRLAANPLDFNTISPDPRLMPTEAFRKCLNQVLGRKGGSLLQYGDPMGYAPLREFIAEKMRRHSMSVSSDEILITNGSQNAIELVLKLLVKRGARIAMENPTYSLAIPLFRYYGAEIAGVPLKEKGRGQEEEGMDLDLLEEMMQGDRPTLVYTMPNFQNPTGITSSQAHRERLLKICEQYRVPLLEDGFVEEMNYFGRTVLPVKSMDRNDIVFYLGSFSKVLFPGLRIGWVAAPAGCMKRLCAIKKAGELSGSTLDQAALNLFCRSGYYDLHIKRVHRVYRRRMHTALSCARKYFPKEKFHSTRPSGGYTLWVTARGGQRSEEEIVSRINECGVAVSPGKIHFPVPTDHIGFRISIAHVNETEIEEGMRRIGEVLRDIY